MTSPRNITYLTGFDILWFYHGSPTGLALRADDEHTLFFDSYHDRMVEDFSYVDEAVFYATFPFHPAGPQLEIVVDTLKERGLLRGTVGLEKWAYAPSPALMQAMEEKIIAAGAKVVDGSWIVDTVGLIKSPLEIACVRKAAELADIGMEAARNAARPGVMELEVTGAMQYAMARGGWGGSRTQMPGHQAGVSHAAQALDPARARGGRDGVRRHLRRLQPIPRQPLPLHLPR